MSENVKIIADKGNDCISVAFYIENENILRIGDEMNKINENAYMNGYNWEVFFNAYLSDNAPELLEGMDTDPEAGMYSAYYSFSEDNMKKADALAELIEELVNEPERLYEYVRENGKTIEWD